MTLDDSWWQLMTIDDSLLLNNVDFRFWSCMHPPTHGQTMLVLKSLSRLKRTDNLRYSFLLLLSNNKIHSTTAVTWGCHEQNKLRHQSWATPLGLRSKRGGWALAREIVSKTPVHEKYCQRLDLVAMSSLGGPPHERPGAWCCLPQYEPWAILNYSQFRQNHVTEHVNMFNYYVPFVITHNIVFSLINLSSFLIDQQYFMTFKKSKH